MLMSHNTYTTKDFYTAVLLKTKGYQLLEVRPTQHKHLEFMFALSPDEGAAICQEYWNRQPETNFIVRDFVDNIKTLKGLLYSIQH